MAKTVAVVLAAGRGRRMNSNVHKQYLLLDGKPVLYYSLKALEDSFINEVILVTGASEIEYCRKEIVEKYHFTKVVKITGGGKERYHSVWRGLHAAASCDYVFIHDGARPFLTGDILQRTYEAVRKERACVAGMPVKDTVKMADDQEFAAGTPSRDRVWMVQTPQVFEYRLIMDAYDELIDKEQELFNRGLQVTDDAMVVETFTDVHVKLVKGSYKNIKITTPEDLKIAEAFLL